MKTPGQNSKPGYPSMSFTYFWDTSWGPTVGDPLSAANQRRRLIWANQHQTFLARQGRNTLLLMKRR